MLVTPLRVKSKGVVGKPARERKGTRKEPRQQSTCRGRDLRKARRERAAMSSMMPCAKEGSEPTKDRVAIDESRDAGNVNAEEGAGQATKWTLMPK